MLTETSTFTDLALLLDRKGMSMNSMKATPEGFVAYVKFKDSSTSWLGVASTIHEAINQAIARVEVS